jgi:hypothetical protein
VKNPAGRQLVPGLAGGGFCALRLGARRLVRSTSRKIVGIRMNG